MDARKISSFRSKLKSDLLALESEDALGLESQKTVALDQQSVGRLSRMDALQQQAMAKATSARRTQQRQRIVATLARIEEGEFGYCAECGDDISLKRLALDPTVPTCINCAKGQ